MRTLPHAHPRGCFTNSELQRDSGQSSPPVAAKVKTGWGIRPQDGEISARMVGETVAQVGPARMFIVGNFALKEQQARAEHATADYH